MTAPNPKLSAQAQNRQSHRKVLPQFPGRRRQLRCTNTQYAPSSNYGYAELMEKGRGPFRWAATWTMPPLLGRDHNKALLGLGKSYRKSMLSCSLHRISSHLCLLGGHIKGSAPEQLLACTYHLSCVGTHVLPLQAKIQGCDPPPDHLVSLNSSQARHCCSLCRGSEGQRGPHSFQTPNTKLGTPAGLMVLCSRVRFCCISHQFLG